MLDLSRAIETLRSDSAAAGLVFAERVVRTLQEPVAPSLEVSASGVIEAAGGIDELTRPARHRPGAIQLPWTSLARLIPAVLPGQLVLIGARPAVGKSIALAQIADRAARDGHGVLMVSLEMSNAQILTRLGCAASRVSLGRLGAGCLDSTERRAFQSALAEIDTLPLWFLCSPRYTLPALSAAVVRRKAAGNLRLVVLDYLGLVDGPGTNSNERVGAVSRGLKRIAMEHGVAVIAATQLSRANETDNREPRLSDLRDSGGQEQDADSVILLSPAKGGQPGEEFVRLVVAKQRSGPTGEATLQRVGRYATLQEPADEQAERAAAQAEIQAND
jgi:replicative DNA helicase